MFGTSTEDRVVLNLPYPLVPVAFEANHIRFFLNFIDRDLVWSSIIFQLEHVK